MLQDKGQFRFSAKRSCSLSLAWLGAVGRALGLIHVAHADVLSRGTYVDIFAREIDGSRHLKSELLFDH
jgi:hypothetical protein